MEKIRPLAWKVNVIIVVSLIVGIGLVIGFLAWRSNESLNARTEANLNTQSELLFQSVKNSMLSGRAEDAVRLLGDVESIGNTTIKLFRTNGVEAFSDNATIRDVNSRIGTTMFEEPSDRAVDPELITQDPLFQTTLEEGSRLSRREETETGTAQIVYSPLVNNARCQLCHGTDSTFRGVIRIRIDVTEVVDQQMRTLALSVGIFLAVVIILTLVLTVYVRQVIITPMKEIGSVCIGVTGGDCDVRVQHESRDEIGVLGETVNTMVKGLCERFKLSKYVSDATERSIDSEQGARREVLTLLFSDVRSFTAFADSRDPAVVTEKLNSVINFQTDAIHNCGGDVDKFVGDEVVAVFRGEDQAMKACRAALQIQREIFGSTDENYGGLKVGVGVNTGEVISGMIGSETRADFTVIGDSVNFASRLCRAAKAGEIIVSESTFKATRGEMKARGPLNARVRGKALPQKVYYLQEEA